MDAYEELELENHTVSQSEVKAAYHRLSLQFHPDKCADKSEKSLARFLRIKEAWESIGTEEKRREYDESSSRAYVNVTRSEPVILEDMDANVDEEGEKFYTKFCRCGDTYNLTLQDLADGYNTVQCDGCSLYITVSTE